MNNNQTPTPETKLTAFLFKKYEEIGKFGIWRLNKNTGSFIVSNNLKTILGASKEYSLTSLQAIEPFIYFADRHTWAQLTQAIAETQLPVVKELRVVQFSSKVKHVRISVDEDVEDGDTIVTGMVQDITETKLKETTITESRHLLNYIVDNTPDIIYVLNLQSFSLSYINKRVESMLGYDEDFFYNTGEGVFQKLLHADDYEKRMQQLHQLENIGDDEIKDIEVRLLAKDGSYRWLKLRDRVFTRRPDGTVLQIIGVGSDITSEKLDAARLSKNEALLKDTEEIALTGSYEIDLATMGFTFSDGMYRILGEAPQSFQPTLELIDSRSHPDDVPVVKEILDKAFENRQPYQYTRRIYNKEGVLCTIEAHGKVVCNEQGEPVKFLGVVRDITERKKAEAHLQFAYRELEEAEKLTKRMLDGSVAAICSLNSVRDQQGNITDFVFEGVNKAAETIIGAELQAVVNKRLKQIMPVVSEHLFVKFVAVVQTGEPFTSKEYFKNDRFNHWLDLSVVKNDDGCILTFYDVTEKYIAEQKLKESRQLLQTVFNTTLMGICVHEAVRDEAGNVIDFRIRLVNRELEKLTGRTNLEGKLYAEEYPGIKQTGVFDVMLRVLKTGEPEQIEYYYNNDGFKHWFSSMFVKNEDGLIATNLDITERKNSEEAIKKHLAILQQAEEMVQMGSWEYDIASKEFLWSDGMYQLFDLPKTEPISPSIYVKCAEVNSKMTGERLARKITKDFSDVDEIINIKTEGSARVLKVQGKVIYDEIGEPVKIVGVDVDLSKQTRAEDIIEAMNDCLVEMDNNWVVKFVNESALIFCKKDKKDVMGKTLWNLFPHSVGSSFYKAVIDAKEKDRTLRKEFTFPEEGRWIYASVTPSPQGIILLFADIGSQKLAAERIRESEQRLRSVFENTPDIITRWDKEKKLIYANKAFEEKTGVANESLFGKNNSEIKRFEDIAEPYIHKLDIVLHTGKSVEHFNYFPTPSGQRYFYTRMVPEFAADGSVQSVLTIARDITDLRNAQEELQRQNQKLVESQQSLERKDNFIRIASHELKTPITSLSGYIQLLLQSYNESEDSFLYNSLTIVNKQVTKLTKLINELLDITRVDTGTMHLQLEMFDLCAMIKESISFIQPTTTHRIVLHEENCQHILGDRDRINQVFVNLLTNAIKYSPSAQRVEVGITTDEHFVTVSVTDHGIGVSKEFHQRIFHRFYRVAGVREQTFAGFGIGLYIASEIIKKHKGKIWVQSEEGHGATFYFSLPLNR